MTPTHTIAAEDRLRQSNRDTAKPVTTVVKLKKGQKKVRPSVSKKAPVCECPALGKFFSF